MNNQTQSVIDALAPLAAKLGDTADHLYYIYVRQVFAEGIAGLVIDGIEIIIVVVIFNILYKSRSRILNIFTNNTKRTKGANKKHREFDYEYGFVGGSGDGFEKFMLGMSVIFAILVILSLTASIPLPLSDLTTNITKVINPEYYAISRILSQVKGLTK